MSNILSKSEDMKISDNDIDINILNDIKMDINESINNNNYNWNLKELINRIILLYSNNISNKYLNIKKFNTRIYCIGIGNGCNHSFLQCLSSFTRGFATVLCILFKVVLYFVC